MFLFLSDGHVFQIVILHIGIVQVTAKSNYQKKKSILHFFCIQTLVMHMTVELRSICGTMFSGICVRVLKRA